jgi:hypothetical protein
MNEDAVSANAKYRPAGGVAWAVEATEVLVWDELAGRRRSLPYPAAAIWDFLAQGRTVQRTSQLLQFVLDEGVDAETLVRTHVQAWLDEGWIRQTSESDNGLHEHGQYLDHDEL